jgi:hypothetical protein
VVYDPTVVFRDSGKKVPADIKINTGVEAQKLIDSKLKIAYIKAPGKDPKCNYNVDVYTKWNGPFFYFCAKYCVPHPGAEITHFESKFEVEQAISLKKCLEILKMIDSSSPESSHLPGRKLGDLALALRNLLAKVVLVSAIHSQARSGHSNVNQASSSVHLVVLSRRRAIKISGCSKYGAYSGMPLRKISSMMNTFGLPRLVIARRKSLFLPRRFEFRQAGW